jgi:hypothetical protein
MHFQPLTLDDVLQSLPDLQSLDDPSDIDLLICASGFEDRTLAVLNRLVELKVDVGIGAYVVYDSNEEHNSRLRDEVVSTMSSISATVRALKIDDLDSQIARALEEASNDECAGPVRVMLDISSASSRLILIALRSVFALARHREVDLRVAYAQAEIYTPSEAEARKLIEAARSVGIDAHEQTLGLDFDAEEAAGVVVYPGQHTDVLPDRVIVICGFNADRVRSALDAIDTDMNLDLLHPMVDYIVGEPPLASNKWRLQAMIDVYSAGDVDTKITPHVTSTLHYKETLQLLEHLYLPDSATQRFTVLPFGSKMQSLATGLFGEVHPDVRVQILAPKAYRGTEYSTGTQDVHELRFGRVEELRARLRSIGTLVEKD